MHKYIFLASFLVLNFFGFYLFHTGKQDLVEGKTHTHNISNNIDKEMLTQNPLSIVHEKNQKLEYKINDNKIKLIFNNDNNIYENIKEISDKDDIKQLLDKTREKKHHKIGKDYINETSCNKLKNKNPINNPAQIIQEKIIPQEDIKKFIGCYIYSNPDHQIKSKIQTSYEEYRDVNIGGGLSTLKNKTWEKGEVISIYDYLKLFNGYIEGRATVNGEKVMIGWGGVCGVSTAAYQVFAEAVDIKILERHNHNILNIDSFGRKGFDSSVFGDGTNPDLDLVAQNQHGKIFVDIIDKANKEQNKYSYGMKLYSWKPFEKYDISFSEEYEKNGRTCVDKIKEHPKQSKTVTSCYIDIIQEDDI
ncbi:VanW family protein [Candidatus Absconditicoccus praedator]|uniref:VanW family protein n=1 Tax=Candidatus Absconditicoccus praedator TaxID=2735562 RepID=UPI001E3A2AC9|nr:VanW family protein [Candidatus Absconditicoccus praedator]UFX82909.1 VanW family protein [Candidatus Absconditicoccus praedator]